MSLANWVTITYRFRCGTEHFTRSFSEASPARCRVAAAAWARAKGYLLLGPA